VFWRVDLTSILTRFFLPVPNSSNLKLDAARMHGAQIEYTIILKNPASWNNKAI